MKEIKFGLIDIPTTRHGYDSFVFTYKIRILREYDECYEIDYGKILRPIGEGFVDNPNEIVTKSRVYGIYTMKLNIFQRFFLYFYYN